MGKIFIKKVWPLNFLEKKLSGQISRNSRAMASLAFMPWWGEKEIPDT